MQKSFFILILILLFAFSLQAQVEQPLKLIRSIPLLGLHDGDFDHFALDPMVTGYFLQQRMTRS